MRRRAVSLIALVFGVALPLHAQIWRTLDVSRARADSAPVAVRVDYSHGRLQARSAVSESLLYDLHLRYDASRTHPLLSFDRAARRISLGTRARDEPVPRSEGRHESEALLQLGRATPLDLMVHLSVSSGILDLGGLALRGLTVVASAGELTVRFDTANTTRMQVLDLDVSAASLRASGVANARADRVRVTARAATADVDLGGQWAGDLELDVEVTLGSVTIHVPAGVGVQLESRRVLSSIKASGLARSGEIYASDNWGTAQRKLHIRANATLAAIELIRDGR